MKLILKAYGKLAGGNSYSSSRLISLTLVLALAFSMSSLLRDTAFGEIVIALYGLAAVIFRVPSSSTFKMALITIIFIPLISIFDPASDLLETLATYGYLLLIVGLVCALLERWHVDHAKKKRTDLK